MRKIKKYVVEIEATYNGSVNVSAESVEDAKKKAEQILNHDTPNWYDSGSTGVLKVTLINQKDQALCHNCEKYPINVKDYRTDEFGQTSSTLSCEYCFNLNDEWHNNVRINSTLDPKKILENK